jgi:hypothetical protein
VLDELVDPLQQSLKIKPNTADFAWFHDIGVECYDFGVIKPDMAKRTPRSQANDTATAPAQPKARRSRAVAAPPEDTIGAYPGIERSEGDVAIARTVSSPSPLSAASGAGPSDADIRARAYQRYLERGGNHGADFEDWLAAERELKGSTFEV